MATEPAEIGHTERTTDAARSAAADRRRRPAVLAIGSFVVVAAGLVGLLFWWTSDTQRPGRVDGSQEVTVTTGCGEFVVPAMVGEYLDDWTSGSHTQGEVCVLKAVDAPDPLFDVSGLGDEQPWLDDDLGRGRLGPWDREGRAGAPIVYIGATALGGDATLPLRLWRSWSDGGSLWCSSTSMGGGCGPIDLNEQMTLGASITDSTSGTTIETFVPSDTAVVALSVDGEPVGWQRPRGRTVQLSAVSSRYLTMTAFDADGSAIAEYRGGP